MARVPATKLHPPLKRADTLLRARLVGALHTSIDRKLQIVIAPAGFGKTTLLADFVHEAGIPACWVTLDATDRDLSTLIHTIVHALRGQYPGFGGRTLNSLNRGGDAERRSSALARNLAAEIEDRVDHFTLLVLDDFHEVNNSAPVTKFVDELLRLLPDNLRIVLAGRSLPNLTVSRLIVEGQMFGLGEADLRFTSGELLALLRQRPGPPLSQEQAAALAEGAEGWIAGFLLSVPRLWDGLVGGLIASGGEGPLYEYLAEEAFDRQPEEMQRFLLATAIPETPTMEVCTLLLGPGDWRSMLDRVEAAGLFLTRLRAPRGAFRYHALFRRFLQERLRRHQPQEYERLHLLMARHLGETGAWQAALTHFNEAGRADESVALVARILPELEATGRWWTLAETVASLPESAVVSQPSVLLAGARAAVMTGDLNRAASLSESARALGGLAQDHELEAWGLALLGNTRRLQGRTREALDLLGRARALASPTAERLHATIRYDASVCLGVQGDFAEAAAEMRAALASLDRLGAAYDAARAEFGLGVALVKAGRVTEAIGHYQSDLERWRALEDAGMEAEMLNCLGCAYGYRGEYERSRTALGEGLRRARDGGYPRTEGATHHSLGEVLLAAGDLAGARSAFERGLAVAQEIGELWTVAQIYDALALTTAFEGNLSRAEEHAQHAVALAKRQDSRYLEAAAALTLGAILQRRGSSEALDTLRAATDTLTEQGAKREMARGHLWLAIAQQHAGAPAAAAHHLRTALRLADDLGSDAVFDIPARWDATPFHAAIEAGIEPERIRVVLARVQADLPPAPRQPVPALPEMQALGFGPGTLLVNGEHEVVWPWDKSRELFFLLLHSGPRRLEQLMAALWPESPPVKARASLHTAVYRLRKATVAEVVQHHGGVFRINEELVTRYDVREFERLVQASLTADRDRAPDLLDRAVRLYTGPLLEGLESEWVQEERNRLAQRHLTALDRLIDAHAEAGNPRESIAAAELLLARDPLREDVHARAIRAYLRLGDRAAAQRQFERCARALREELGVEPGVELQNLARRISA